MVKQPTRDLPRSLVGLNGVPNICQKPLWVITNGVASLISPCSEHRVLAFDGESAGAKTKRDGCLASVLKLYSKLVTAAGLV